MKKFHFRDALTVTFESFPIDVLMACINKGDFFFLLLRGTQLMNRETNDFSCNISSIRRSVSSPDETLRRELKIRRVAEYF